MNIRMILSAGAVFLGLAAVVTSPAVAGDSGPGVQDAAAAYHLGKEIGQDIASLASGPSKCVRHFYNHSSSIWFVNSASLGKGDDKAYAIKPGQTVPVFYNGNGGVLEVTGPGYHDMFGVKGCYLDHNGNTGRATLNDPADGDIAFDN